MKNVLVLPGGGIRGYVQARFLSALQEHTGRPVANMFDLIVGTSTGGILAIAMGLGFGPRQIVSLYRDRGPDIFHRPWWRRAINPLALRAPKYTGDELKRELEALFGDARLSSSLVPIMVPTYNWTRRSTVLLKSWHPAKGLARAVHAAMATSSAPTYFPPYRAREDGDLFVDGGVYANHPVDYAAAEAVKLFGVDEFRVLVVDNGQHDGTRGSDSATGWGLLGWAPHIASVFMDSGMDGATYIGAMLADLMSAGNVFVSSPNGLAVDMDDASDWSFEQMERAVRERMVPEISSVAAFLGA